MSETGRTASSASSVATARKSPLGVVRLAWSLETVVRGGEGRGGVDDDDDGDDGSGDDGDGNSSIDDGAALQAKLRELKPTEEVRREEKGWSGTGNGKHMSYELRASEEDQDGRLRRLNFTPLHVRKTRGSGAKFGGGVV